MAFDRLPAPTERRPHSLDRLPLSRRYAVRIADDKELPERGSVFVVVRDEQIVGGAACLYLNPAGLAQLRSGAFSYGAPNVDVLTLSGEPTAAIYAWALCLPGLTIGAIGNVMQWLQRALFFCNADIFARPATTGGMRFMRDTGFVASGFCTPDLWIYQRRPRSNFEYFN